MVIYCGVPNCKTVGTNGFHVFPADNERRKQWMRNTQILDLGRSESVKICRKHFEDCYLVTEIDGKKHLTADAVPRLLLPEPITRDSEHSYCSV